MRKMRQDNEQGSEVTRAKPSMAMLRLIGRRIQGRYSVSAKDIARTMKMSFSSAVRYITLLEDAGIIEFWYQGRDRYYYYRIRRDG